MKIVRDTLDFILRALQYVYSSYLRPRLPRKKSELNGVSVNCYRIFDNWVPGAQTHPCPSEYEHAIVSSINKHVERGDEVTIVGGGWGVTTVTAANAVGDEGCVTTFEASAQYTKYTQESVELNGVEDLVTVENKIVSHAISTLGDSDTETVVKPSQLPDCDVLELDCEGAEVEILTQMTTRPRTIIVETHGMNGSPTDEVTELLESIQYDICSIQPAERGELEKYCKENDIQVVTAINTNSTIPNN